MGSPRPFTVANGALSVPLDVLHMPGGRIPVPNRTKSLLVEIGTNSFDTWDQTLLPRKPHAFLVAFEPLVDKWALLLARHARSRVAGPLGFHHERGIILPFAVAEREGVLPFHVSPRDGCSSLREVHVPRHGGWKGNGFIRNACAKTVQVRHVPAVTLRTVLGEWLAGWRVERLKIDAQGADLAVLDAAGEAQLARVGEVSMETLSDTCDALYASQPNCTVTLREMRRLGFVTSHRCDDRRAFTQGSGCEANVVFRNARAAWQAAGLDGSGGGGRGRRGGGGHAGAGGPARAPADLKST